MWFGTRIEIEYLDTPRLDSWRGPDPFSMRQKIALLQVVWPQDGYIVLLDADLIATANLSPFVDALGRGQLFMHKREYQFGRTRRIGNRRLWQSLRGRSFGAWQVAEEDAMWNSGVVGVSAGDRALVDQALELYETMGAAGVRHFATEQLVESLVLGVPVGSMLPNPGSRTIGATGRATTPRLRAGWPTRSSRGCRSRKPPPATASGQSTCRSSYGGPALKSYVAGWGAASGLSMLNKDHLVGGASRLAALLLP